jgi:dTDP-4-amino-4,6-dideoxygalactose transaminase
MKIVSSKPTITRKELEAVLDCLINDEMALGESVKTFEAGISKLTGIHYALAVNSLTAAYHLVFKALGINESSEVIMPAFFPQSPLSALLLTGGRPVFADNEKNALFPSPDLIKEKISERTKAIVIGHLFGYHYPVRELARIGVPVIEDISHALGTEVDDIPCGANGTFAVASFDPSGIITTGNGGAVCTGNSKHYSLMKDLRGGHEGSVHFDYSLTDFQAAMGISQLAKLSDLLARRREIAHNYIESLRITPHKAPFQYSENFAYHSFPVFFDASNEKIESYWRKTRIEVVRILKYPLHTLLGMNGSDFPHSDRCAKKLFAIPMYPTLSRKNVEKISKLLANFI